MRSKDLVATFKDLLSSRDSFVKFDDHLIIFNPSIFNPINEIHIKNRLLPVNRALGGLEEGTLSHLLTWLVLSL